MLEQREWVFFFVKDANEVKKVRFKSSMNHE